MGTYSETESVSGDLGSFPLVFVSSRPTGTARHATCHPLTTPSPKNTQRMSSAFNPDSTPLPQCAHSGTTPDWLGKEQPRGGMCRHQPLWHGPQNQPGPENWCPHTAGFPGSLHHTVQRVCGHVVSRVREEDGSCRIGVQFNYCVERQNYSRTIDNALSQIEAFCRRQMARYRR